MTSESVEIKIEDPQKQQLLSSLSGTFDGVEIKTLATKFCSRYGVEVKNRTWHLKKYKMCFVGSEAVDWLVKEMPSWSREKAVHFGTHVIRISVRLQDPCPTKTRCSYAVMKFNVILYHK